MEPTKEVTTVDDAWQKFIAEKNDYLPSPAAYALFVAGWKARPAK